MARYLSSFLGVAVAATALTGVHLDVASGTDLGTLSDRFEAAGLIAPASKPQVNRAGKSDRASATTTSAEALRTISLRVDQLRHTSVLVRIRAGQVRSDGDAPNAVVPAKTRPVPGVSSRKMVACEPVVSALTEVAKRLDSGRCVT